MGNGSSSFRYIATLRWKKNPRTHARSWRIREFNNAKNAINNEIKEGMKEADRKALESEKEK